MRLSRRAPRCRSQPELAAERTRKHAEFLDATEKALVKIRAMTERQRNPLGVLA